MKLNYKIKDNGVKAQFEALDRNTSIEVEQSIRVLTEKLRESVKNNKLSGQVLKVKTGNLKNSISTSFVENKKSMTGVVSTNVKYAGVHEYGFSGSVVVKAHLRNIKQAFGKPITPRDVMVTTFSKKMNMPERSFMRSALNDMKSEIFEELDRSVDRAAKSSFR